MLKSQEMKREVIETSKNKLRALEWEFNFFPNYNTFLKNIVVVIFISICIHKFFHRHTFAVTTSLGANVCVYVCVLNELTRRLTFIQMHKCYSLYHSFHNEILKLSQILQDFCFVCFSPLGFYFCVTLALRIIAP
jgi:hypothetical protein